MENHTNCLFLKSQEACSLEGQLTLFAFTEHVKIVAAHLQLHRAAVLGLENNEIPHTDGTAAAEMDVPIPVRKGRKILSFRIDLRFLRDPGRVIVFIPDVQAAQQRNEFRPSLHERSLFPKLFKNHCPHDWQIDRY